jgi:hypothetical protein
MEGFTYNLTGWIRSYIVRVKGNNKKKAIPIIDLLSSGVQKTEDRQKDNEKDREYGSTYL